MPQSPHSCLKENEQYCIASLEYIMSLEPGQGSVSCRRSSSFLEGFSLTMLAAAAHHHCRKRYFLVAMHPGTGPQWGRRGRRGFKLQHPASTP